MPTKKAAPVGAKNLQAHRCVLRSVRRKMVCQVPDVTRAGFYEWCNRPLSNRVVKDARLLQFIRASFIASHGIYGAPRVFLDLREAGETRSKHRVARLMRQNNRRALHGFRARRVALSKPSILIPDILQRQFTVMQPNKAWVTDITYIRTGEGGCISRS
jgi:putative transposase